MWVETVTVSRGGDVVYPVFVELCRVDEREEIGEEEPGGDLLWREWVGGWLGANRVIKSEFFWLFENCMTDQPAGMLRASSQNSC